MDLTRNRNAEFTRWVVSAGLLNEPFVLIDVGVQGGENKRWRPLGDCLVVHGFDPIEEAVQQLVEENRGRANRHYHCMALGKSDGEQAFYFNPANPTASSMYQESAGRFAVVVARNHKRWLAPSCWSSCRWRSLSHNTSVPWLADLVYSSPFRLVSVTA
jgi:hypothetical protein